MAQQAKTLSPVEVDALLTALPSDGMAAPQAKPRNVKVYDFKRPDKFSKDHLRTLHVLHQALGRTIGNSLSSRLRTVTTVKLSSIDQVLYEEYISLIPTPTVLHVIAMEPLPGNVLLEYSTKVGLLMVDRLLGGIGRSYDEPHEITDLEMALINKFANSFQGLLRDAWLNVTEIEPRLQGTELSSQFIQIAAPGDVVIMVLYEIQIGEQIGAMSLCIPYSTLESALPRLTTQGWIVSSNRAAAGDGDREAIRRTIGRAEVGITAHLGTTEITAADLVSLEPGDVIRLDSLATREIDLRVGSRRKFSGLPGLAGNRVGIKITTVHGQAEE